MSTVRQAAPSQLTPARNDESEVRAFESADPAKTKLGMHYEVLPMFALVHAGT